MNKLKRKSANTSKRGRRAANVRGSTAPKYPLKRQHRGVDINPPKKGRMSFRKSCIRLHAVEFMYVYEMDFLKLKTDWGLELLVGGRGTPS